MARHGLVVLLVLAITILAAAPRIQAAKQADASTDSAEHAATVDALHVQSGLLLRDRKLLAVDAVDAADQDRRRPPGGGGGSRGGGFGGGSRPGGGEVVFEPLRVHVDILFDRQRVSYAVGLQGVAAGRTLALYVCSSRRPKKPRITVFRYLTDECLSSRYYL
jgi:type II secretory pathway pseudopilin PulG